MSGVVTYDDAEQKLTNMAVGYKVIVTSTAQVIKDENGSLQIDTTKMEQTITVNDTEVAKLNPNVIENPNGNGNNSQEITDQTVDSISPKPDDANDKQNNSNGIPNNVLTDDKSGGASRRQRSRKSARRHSVTKTRRQLRSTAKRLRRK